MVCFVFEACTGCGDELHNILTYRKTLVNELIVVGNAAEYAEQAHLVLVGERRIEPGGIVIVHRLEIKGEVDASEQGVVACE